MEIRSYKKSDSVNLTAFIERCFLQNTDAVARSHTPEYYAWKFKKNPFGEPIVWLAEEKDRIVGLLGIVPRQIKLEAQKYIAGEMVDAFIDPDFHGKGVFQKLAAKAFSQGKKNGIDYFYTTPNETARRIWTKAYKFQEVFEYRSLIRPLSFHSILYHKLPFKPIAYSVGKPLSLAYNFIFNGKSLATTCELLSIKHPKQEIEQIWNRVNSSFKYGFVKIDHYLNWRFVENPEDFKIFLIRHEDELRGYFVIKINRIKGFQFAHIVDLMLPLPEQRMFYASLQSLLALLSKQNIDFVSAWAIKDSSLIRLFKSSGFFERNKRYRFLIKNGNKTAGIPKRIHHIDEWNFSQGDTDLI